ncbi:MAG: Flp pilus assembly complex ATPase component TadA, partial [Holophagales bacterium]|nr:Flp pilus assembly complex ATPase component TadA [Holophagales bacterium]
VEMTFARGLRAILRQDPDVVMVGEIRDLETAEIAVQASLTGHLVLSTLHTNDAPSTINRLMNMGIEPFLVATSVHLVVAQRLVRRICTYCKEPFDVNPAELIQIGFSEREARTLKLFKGRGCDQCGDTGYKGRTGLYEVMKIDDELRDLILSGASSLELREKAIENGMISLRGSGLQKIRDGMSSIEEVVRETVI